MNVPLPLSGGRGGGEFKEKGTDLPFKRKTLSLSGKTSD